jgi:hypothetical protein
VSLPRPLLAPGLSRGHGTRARRDAAGDDVGGVARDVEVLDHLGLGLQIITGLL